MSSLRDGSWALVCSGEASDFLSTGSTPASVVTLDDAAC